MNILAQRGKTLKSLILNEANIRSIGLSYLWIAFSDINDDLKLDALSVRGNNIGLEWAKRLNSKLSSPLKVKSLDLGDNCLNDPGSKYLATYFSHNTHIESLDLSCNGLTKDGLRSLKELIWLNGGLKELILRGNLDIDESVEMCERRMRVSETKQKIIYY